MGAIRRCAVGALIVLASASLVACTGPDADPDPESTSVASPSSEPSPEAEPEPEPDPELVPDGSAEDNLPYFDFVNEKVLAEGNPGGRPIVDNLVDAGFDKGAMEVTADRTPLGSEVDSVQFSVLIGDDCLLGQAGAGGY